MDTSPCSNVALGDAGRFMWKHNAIGLGFESDAAGLTAPGEVPQGCVVNRLVAYRNTQIDAGSNRVASAPLQPDWLAWVCTETRCTSRAMPTRSDGASKTLPIRRPNSCVRPDQTRIGGVTKLRAPWGRGQSDRRRAKCRAGAHLPVVGTLEIELGIEVVPESNVDIAGRGSGS